MELEKRAGSRIELRANDDGTVAIEGYAAVFNESADIAGIFREVIRPGAFRNALKRGDDVIFNINHNDNFLLARTTSGTLQLTEDEKGLKIRSELDASDPDVARLLPKMRRGDLSKMSFAFSIPEGGDEWTASADGQDVREVKDVMLHDVAVVTAPAYEGTSIALRSRDASKEDAGEAKREAEKNRAAYASRKAEAEQKFRGLGGDK